MAIRYEYNSTCCAHLYLETRNANTAPIVTKCNVCGQGEYVEISQTEIETIAEPVYQGLLEPTTDENTEGEIQVILEETIEE